MGNDIRLGMLQHEEYMIIECGWCHELLGEKEPFHDTSVTHSICEVCQKNLLAQYEIKEHKRKEAA